MNIGIFDSGLGGLTILKSFIKNLPQYNYIYLGDNARVPYGNRSDDLIYEFTTEAIDFFVKKNCLLIIIACNTSTAAALRKIQQEYLPKKYQNIKVLGVIRPTVEKVIENKYKKVGIIGTNATINSQAFKKEILKLNPSITIYQKGCPLLVPYIEDGNKNKKILKLLLKDYLKDIKNKIEALVLGCTHYEIIKNEIKKVTGKNVKIISEGEIVAMSLKKYLNNHQEIERKLAKNKKIELYFTDFNRNYEKIMKIFFGKYWKNYQFSHVKI
ncbi:MAG: glutamate racemase [Candidatus Microgenomates bacterium]